MSSSKPLIANAPLLIFGAGGHGRVVVDAALVAQHWKLLVVSDRQLPENQNELLPGIQLITVDAALKLDPAVHIAIGNNQFRQKEAGAWGFERLISVVHPAAVVSIFSSVLPGCFVGAGSIVGPLAQVGMGVIINHGAVVDHDVEVGAFSHIAPNASLGGHVRIGQRVLIGSGAVVLPFMVIADDVIVGAGSVVTGNLLESGTYAGIPARKIL